MSSESPSPSSRSSGRLPSLDVLRGLTILVMIFVNDLAAVGGAPAWMKHLSPSDGDGMTFVDVVFPAFLFIVGMSIPFATGRRLDRGDSPWSVWRHVLARTLGLLVIGVFMVNAETMPDQGLLPAPLWKLLMYVGVFLVWSAPPRASGRPPQRSVVLRGAGAFLLILLAFLFRGRGESALVELRPQWWGILGLIGWAYLVACTVYLATRRSLTGATGTVPLLYCVFIAHAAGAFSGWTWLTDWIRIGPMLGSQAGIAVSGLALGIVLAPGSPLQAHRDRIRWGLLYGLTLGAAAHLLHAAHDVHRMFIFNKNMATPPWCLQSSAITIALWVLLYWSIEVEKLGSSVRFLQAAGQNPLTAYLLAPVLYCSLDLVWLAAGLPDLYAALGATFAVGFWRSVFMAVLVAWLAAILRRLGVQLAL